MGIDYFIAFFIFNIAVITIAISSSRIFADLLFRNSDLKKIDKQKFQILFRRLSLFSSLAFFFC